MDTSIHLLYLILIFISGFTVLFAPFGLIFSSACFKTMHFNLKFLTLTLGILWCILPLGGLYFYFIIDVDENPPYLYQKFSYQIAKNICATSGFAFRVTETAICIERLLATVFFKTYESKIIFRFYPFVALLMIISISFSFSFLFNIFRIPAIVIYVFLITVETINFTLMHFLKKQNQKLRKISNIRNALLSSKYQLIENIKSLKLLFPQTTISFVISNITIAQAIIHREFFIEGFATPIYFTLYCLNVITLSLYWTYQSSWFKSKISKFRKTSVSQINDFTNDAHLRMNTVNTALGEPVKAQQTVDEHFEVIRNVWK